MSDKERLKYINDLDEFVCENAERIDSFCSSLGWSTSQVSFDLDFAVCPLDPGHRVPNSSLDEHIESCQLTQKGYLKDELFPPCYPEGGPTLTLGQKDVCDIIQSAASSDPTIPTVSLADAPDIPQSASRLFTSLSTRQRLALYEFVVKTTAHQSPSDLKLTEADLAFDSVNQTPSKNERPKSFLELLAEQRDAKRRRLNYRQAKKVHTKHKSQTEVTREVIENQMELYMEWLRQNNSELQVKTESNNSTEDLEQGVSIKKQDYHEHSFHTGSEYNKCDKYHGRKEKGVDRRHQQDVKHDRRVKRDHSHDASYGSFSNYHPRESDYQQRNETFGDSCRHRHKKEKSSHRGSSYDHYDSQTEKSSKSHHRKHKDKHYRDVSPHSFGSLDSSKDRHSRKKYKHKHSSKE